MSIKKGQSKLKGFLEKILVVEHGRLDIYCSVWSWSWPGFRRSHGFVRGKIASLEIFLGIFILQLILFSG